LPPNLGDFFFGGSLFFPEGIEQAKIQVKDSKSKSRIPYPTSWVELDVSWVQKTSTKSWFLRESPGPRSQVEGLN